MSRIKALTHRELSELLPFGSCSDWAKAFLWPSVSVYERVVGVCKSYSCSFLILEAYSWRLRPCKHTLLRLANPPSPVLYIINMLMSWFVAVLVSLHQCLHSPPAPSFLGCLSFLHFLHTPTNPATLDAVVTKLCVPGSQSI